MLKLKQLTVKFLSPKYAIWDLLSWSSWWTSFWKSLCTFFVWSGLVELDAIFFFCLFLWALKLHLCDGLVVIFYDHQSVEVWSPGVEGRAFQENGSLRTEATKGPLTTSVSRTRLLCPFCTEAGFAHLPLSPETLSPALTTPQICTGNNKQHLMNFSSLLRLDVGYSCCRPVSWSSWSEPEQALLSWNMNWVMM